MIPLYNYKTISEEIKNSIGDTADVGGTINTGTVMGKLNSILNNSGGNYDDILNEILTYVKDISDGYESLI